MHPNRPDCDAATLVVVTGSGRSGTSTVAGALKMLGLHIPQPEIAPNDANPRGYFEPKWAVAFHKKVLSRAGVRTLDGRPEAIDAMAAVTSDADLLDELRTWFATQLQGPQIVVKDPRTFWLRELWAQAATSLGVETVWLTMLRHPAEVVGSRDMHYLKGADADQRLARETTNLAGWVNVALTNERTSRGDRRVFVHYGDLDHRLALHDDHGRRRARAALRRRSVRRGAPRGRRLHRPEPAPIPAHPRRPGPARLLEERG